MNALLNETYPCLQITKYDYTGFTSFSGVKPLSWEIINSPNSSLLLNKEVLWIKCACATTNYIITPSKASYWTTFRFVRFIGRSSRQSFQGFYILYSSSICRRQLAFNNFAKRQKRKPRPQPKISGEDLQTTL